MKQVIGIRADANDEVALGHIMRCITIAKQLGRLGSEPVFFTADGYASDLLEQAGMQQVCLGTLWKDMAAETGRLREELEKAGCRKLLVDSYQATKEYFQEIRDIGKIIYIDDCFEEIYPVDMVINYNAYHTRFPYREAYEGKAKLLLGTGYVPLREEFQREFQGFQETAEGKAQGKLPEPDGKGRDLECPAILLSSGGGDPQDALSGILESVERETELGKATFHVVVGRYNPNREKLAALAAKNPGIRLHCDVQDMAGLMAQCDMAVSAAGTVLFELCAMQVPTVFFACVDNQQYDSEFFAREERMLFAGDIRQDREGCLGRVKEGMKTLLADAALRERMKTALGQVTDGRGATRIAEEIQRL